MNALSTQNTDQLAFGDDVTPRHDIVSRIDEKFRPVWEPLPTDQRTALARYFLPHKSSKESLAPTRPRLIKWYCPFAGQATFPSGHRYCINTYTGCSHRCRYCYAAGYEPDEAGPKREFASLLAKDLAHRRRFTTVTILTKNPGLAASPEYARLLAALGTAGGDHPAAAKWRTASAPAVQVEVSLAFWREDASRFWDPGAPPVAERIAGIRALREAGIPIVLRIDPLFPRSPLPLLPAKSLSDFGLAEAQTAEDLESLVALAKTVGARHVVFSPVKVVQPRRNKMSIEMGRLLDVYRAMAWPEKAVWRGGSWRLPPPATDRLVTVPFLEICRRHGVSAKFCMQNLVETP